eukprot:3224016-Pleurochrysis_carterae.AAC.1
MKPRNESRKRTIHQGARRVPKTTVGRGGPLKIRWRTRRAIYVARAVRRQRRCPITTAVPAVGPNLRRRAARSNQMVAAHFAMGRAFRQSTRPMKSPRVRSSAPTRDMHLVNAHLCPDSSRPKPSVPYEFWRKRL